MLQRLRDGSNLHERQLAHAAFPRAGLCQLIVLCSPACAAAQFGRVHDIAVGLRVELRLAQVPEHRVHPLEVRNLHQQ